MCYKKLFCSSMFTEPKKEEPKEEDFIFGDYTPSSVGGLGRPESAPPPRRSVR